MPGGAMRLWQYGMTDIYRLAGLANPQSKN